MGICNITSIIILINLMYKIVPSLLSQYLELFSDGALRDPKRERVR